MAPPDAPARLTFEPISDFPRGTFSSIVMRSYQTYVDKGLAERAETADQQTFDNLETIGRCVTATCVEGKPIGLVSYDPRTFPKAIVGQNCIVPEFRGRGLGREQIRKLLATLRGNGFETASVTTSDHPFFEPARRMYQACGFCEVARKPMDGAANAKLIEFEADLRKIVV